MLRCITGYRGGTIDVYVFINPNLQRITKLGLYSHITLPHSSSSSHTHTGMGGG